MGLSDIPEGDWYCTACVESREAALNSKAASAKGGKGKSKASKAALVEEKVVSEPVGRRSARAKN